ncbi:MAG: MFS transporter [Gaiellaceae bacterium]
MMRRPAWLSRTLQSYRIVARNSRLLTVELAWGAAISAEWAHFVALGVFAYQTDGALGVGLVGFIRLVPAALIAPFAASLGDRWRRERFLGVVCLLGTIAFSASAAAYSLGPYSRAIYAAAAVAAIASTLIRPALQALLPSLASTPDELVAANAFSATLESLGTFVGPAVGGIVVAAADAGWVFAGASVLYAVATTLVASVTVEGRRLTQPDGDARGRVLGGFRVLATEPGPRIVILLMIAQTFVRGALNVLIVVVAFDILDAGAGWVGLLNAAVGAGGLVGAFVAAGVVGRHLAQPFALALVLWGIPIVLLAGAPHAVLAFTLVALIGVANSIEDVTGFTLLQRIVDDEVLTRVLGALWGLAMAGLAVGSIATSLLLEVAGNRVALIAIGAILPVATLVAWARLSALDRTAVAPAELERIAGVPMFGPLPVATKEQLARRLERREVPADTVIVRAGDEGDSFYIVGEGELEVLVPGREPATSGAGDYFGEIALLRDVPRTATVRTITPCTLFVLGRENFLTAVTGHEAGHAAGERVVATRLGEAPS